MFILSIVRCPTILLFYLRITYELKKNQFVKNVCDKRLRYWLKNETAVHTISILITFESLHFSSSPFSSSLAASQLYALPPSQSIFVGSTLLPHFSQLRFANSHIHSTIFVVIVVAIVVVVVVVVVVATAIIVSCMLNFCRI